MSSKEQKDRDEKVAWKLQIDTALTKLGFKPYCPSDIAEGYSTTALRKCIEQRSETMAIGFVWNRRYDQVSYIIPFSMDKKPYITNGEAFLKDGRC